MPPASSSWTPTSSPRRKRFRRTRSPPPKPASSRSIEDSLNSAGHSRQPCSSSSSLNILKRLPADHSDAATGSRPRSACSGEPVFKVPDSSTRAPRRGFGNGLRAKFLSLSTGRLDEPQRPAPTRSESTWSGLANHLSRSITSLTKLTQKRKKRKEEAAAQETPTTSTSGTASTSSLSRCVWPTPWLEAIFLPEFPIRSPLGEESFSLLNAVGSGSFGEVWRVSVRDDPSILFALKRQSKRDIIGRDAVLQIREEVRVHKLLSEEGGCAQIARWYASWQSRTHLFTVLQYAAGYGDLFALWRDYGPLPEATVIIYAMELASAIDFMHRRRVVYRDLKLENVVLDVEGHAQIVDFGLAKVLPEDGGLTKTICGTLQYMAPEVSRGEPYGFWVDWWCLGVVLHVLLTSRYPYPNAEARSHRDLRYIDYSSPRNCTKQLASFFDALLHPLIERRLRDFDSLRLHEVFRERSFEDAAEKKLEPLASVRGFGRCESCNNSLDKESVDFAAEGDDQLDAFEEHYEFNDFEYFNDRYA